jgi:hypothetical protein
MAARSGSVTASNCSVRVSWNGWRATPLSSPRIEEEPSRIVAFANVKGHEIFCR